MRNTGKRILACVLAVVLMLTVMVPVISIATQNEESSSVTVYLTVSNDGWFVKGKDSKATTLARVPIEVEYFSLSDYGLEQYNRYETESFEDGGKYINENIVEKPTLLHLIIKATEVYMLNGRKYDSETDSAVLNISGNATSMFFNEFWGYGYNINYYVNHEYPLMTDGFGATADYIILEDNAEIDIAAFGNYNFFSDTNSGFAYFDDSQHNISVGDKVDFQTMKTAQDMSNYGVTLKNPCDFLTTLILDSDFKTVDSIDSSKSNGAFSYTFNKAGTFYVVALDENLPASNPSAGSTASRIAPAVSKVVVAEKSAEEEYAGAFCLVAESEDKLIIEPEWVKYKDGQTILEALKATAHTFDGIEQGFIYSIDGVIYTPYVTSDNGVYQLQKEASEIANVFRFGTSDGVPSRELVDLMLAMADYNASREYRDSDDVSAAYNAAKAEYIGIGNERAQYHTDAIRAAMAKLDTAERFTVQFNVTQADVAATGYEISVKNSKDTEMKAKADGTYELLAGTYSFEISKGYNAVYGTVAVTDKDVTVSPELPSGHHFENNIFLTSGYGVSTELAADTENQKLSTDFASNVHEYTVYYTDEESLNPYLHSSNEDGWDLLNRDEYFVYYTINNPTYKYGTEGFFKSGKKIVERLGGTIAGVLTAYGTSGQVRLTHEVTDENGYVQIQSYYITVERIRTLSSLEIHDGNGALSVKHTDGTQLYSATVIDSTQSVKLYPSIGGTYESGYSVSINGKVCEENGFAEVPLSQEETTTVPVVVSYLGGSSNEYTVKITKAAAYQSVVTLETEGATLVMTNAVGSVITPEKVTGNVYTYQLATGTTYTCTASKGVNRTVCTFPAEHISNPQFEIGKEITLKVLEEDNWLSDLAFGKLSSSSSKGSVSISPSFASKTHSYTVVIPDSTSTPYVWATVNADAVFPSTSKTITAVYTKLPSSEYYIGTEEITSVTVKSGQTNGTKLSNLNGKYGDIQPFEIRVSSTAGGKTYMQVYSINPIVYPDLSSVSIKADGAELTLTPKFNKDVLEYTISASELTKVFTVTAKVSRKSNKLSVNGVLAASEEAVAVSMADIKNDTILITAKSTVGTEKTYKIKINRLPALDIPVKVEPAEAIVFITDNTGARVNRQENGTYKMLDGAEYDYTVSCNGYIPQSGTFTVSADGELNITLAKAPENAEINKDIGAAWPMFRGDNTNNGTVASKTPKTADETVLYWATKDGEGYDSDAISCPIIVNDYLVYCTGNELHRMNRHTGEVDKLKGTMVAKSNFNIIPPTYADGMIFVALSNGTIQAFNAETFESLWIYKDALGGQPNSPIVYNNGYVYTGFWVGETKKANFVCVSVTDEEPDKTDEAKTASWTYTQLGGFYWAGAYVCDSFILVGTDDGDSSYLKDTSNLLAFNTKTGELIDKIENLDGDIRSSVSYDEVTDRYYFTTKGGSFYGIAVNSDGTFKKDENGIQGYDFWRIALYNYSDNEKTPPMSTCTPVIHNGRAYIGVSGVAQFGAYSGHNITVIDLASRSIAYTVQTKGYPQTSGLLTTAYESEDGYAYIYFIDNYTPGQVRVIKDKPGITEAVGGVKESYMNKGEVITVTCAPVLFTPSGEQAQYAICSPICDENGTLYFKNDSAYMMAVGSKPVGIEVKQSSEKSLYVVGEAYDTAAVKVTAKFANGTQRDVTDYVTFNESSASLTVDDTDVTVYYGMLYGDKFDAENGNASNVAMTPCEAYIPITVITAEQKSALDSVTEKISAIGEVTLESGSEIAAARTELDALEPIVFDLVENISVLTDAEAEYQTIKNVYDMIEGIGEVTYEKAEQIEKSKKAYDALNEKQKAKITNSDKLSDAKASLDLLIADINNVIKQIDSIGKIALSSESKITAAREAYNALPEKSKQGVTNIGKLTAAEATIAGMKGDIAKIENLIDAIGEVTAGKKNDIEAARAGYDSLPEELKSAVDNYDALVAAEAKYDEINNSIADTEKKIDAIGTVTLGKKDKIKAAREAYDSLDNDAKELVSNYEVLEKAERVYNILDMLFGWIIAIFEFFASIFEKSLLIF